MSFKSKQDINAFAESMNDGEIVKTFGPSEFSSGQVWELWVFVESENEYYTRFVYDDGSSELKYFSEFQEFCVFANAIASERQASVRQKTITLYVASFVFVACAITLLALISFDRVQGFSGFALLAGLIASGARMFYGEWIQPKLS